MISLNQKKYDVKNYKISWGEFSYTINGIQESGLAPRIFFECDIFTLMVELAYDIKKFKSMERDKEIDITSYIISFVYSDEKRWLPMYDNNAKCIVKKIDNDNFNFKIEFNTNELDGDTNINVNETVSFR